MSLDQEIEERRTEIHSDGYPMSIGEIMNLYRDGELDIHPEFQWYYRWSDEQKSRLIESLLLGIPIPSIFVSQREDGVWDVIDGLQRLSTILEFAGELQDSAGQKLPPLSLKKTKYLPSLEGKVWSSENPDTHIGSANRLLIRRSKLDVKIILRESSEDSKYELFQRLNTGGSQLSEQELRNVILIAVNPAAYRWIADLAEEPDFLTSVALSERLIDQQYHLDLVTRFLVFRKMAAADLRSVGDIGEFLNDAIVEFAQSKNFPENQEVEAAAFRFTFKQFANSLAEHSFHRYDHQKGRHLGGFSVSAFEPMALGLGYNYELYQDRGGPVPDIAEVSKKLWKDDGFLRYSGNGVRASFRIPANIPIGRRLFAPCQ